MKNSSENLNMSLGNLPTIRGEDHVVLGRIDRYELLGKLGAGGFGAVYMAKDSITGIDEALKVLPPLVAQIPEELERMKENFALVEKLHHPNIATLKHLHCIENIDSPARELLQVAKGGYLMVMEYVPGSTLSAWRKRFKNGIIPVAEALEICGKVAEALDYAHQKRIVHRDIKPANIMITPVSETELPAITSSLEHPYGEVKVLDFGLAAEIRSTMARVSIEHCDSSGTRPYMAPEQWAGKKQGAFTDQYALAAMLHELLSGEVPFQSVFQTNDMALMRDVVKTEMPDSVPQLTNSQNEVLFRALSKDPQLRFHDCCEFINSIRTSKKESTFPLKTVFKVVTALSIVGLLGVGALRALPWINSLIATKEPVKEEVVDPLIEAREQAVFAKDKALSLQAQWEFIKLEIGKDSTNASKAADALLSAELFLEQDNYQSALVRFNESAMLYTKAISAQQNLWLNQIQQADEKVQKIIAEISAKQDNLKSRIQAADRGKPKDYFSRKGGGKLEADYTKSQHFFLAQLKQFQDRMILKGDTYNAFSVAYEAAKDLRKEYELVPAITRYQECVSLGNVLLDAMNYSEQFTKARDEYHNQSELLVKKISSSTVKWNDYPYLVKVDQYIETLDTRNATIIYRTTLNKLKDLVETHAQWTTWKAKVDSINATLSYCRVSPSVTYNDLIGLAKDASKKDDLGNSTGKYKQAVTHFESSGETHFNIGESYELKRDYLKAISWYEKASRLNIPQAQHHLGNIYVRGLGVKVDYTKALTMFRQAATQNQPESQNYLGHMYETGKGVAKNYSEALKWYKKAAMQGYVTAQFNVALMYENARGTSVSYHEAFQWYLKAAKQNHIASMYAVGYMFEKQRGTRRDYAESLKWFRKCAKENHAPSQNYLGHMYQFGKGVVANYPTAIEWYRKSAVQNYSDAMNSLGYMHESGQGTARSQAEAAKWYKKAADLNLAVAQTNLGYLYLNGWGVSKDQGRAFELFNKAAQQNFARGQYLLATMYENGYGVTKNYTQAFGWYLQAANQGHGDAINNLGGLYAMGRGIEKNYPRALTWFRKGIAMGNVSCENYMGYMYEYGFGVTKSRYEAIKWYSSAAKKGHTKAAASLQRLKGGK